VSKKASLKVDVSFWMFSVGGVSGDDGVYGGNREKGVLLFLARQGLRFKNPW